MVVLCRPILTPPRGGGLFATAVQASTGNVLGIESNIINCGLPGPAAPYAMRLSQKSVTRGRGAT